MSARIPRIQRLTWSFIWRADRLPKITRNARWRRLWRMLRERIECWTWRGRMMRESSMLRQARLTAILRFSQPLNRMREKSILWDRGRVMKRGSGSAKPCARHTMTSTDLMLGLHDSSTATDPDSELRAFTGGSSPDSYSKRWEEMTSLFSGMVPRRDRFLSLPTRSRHRSSSWAWTDRRRRF